MLRQFEEGGSGGAIVNIGSVGSMTFQMGGRVSAAYAASKAAVEAFSRSTAIAFAKKGIRVNTVVPGSMHTPLVENRLARQLGKDDVAKLIAERNASVPMGAWETHSDVANAVHVSRKRRGPLHHRHTACGRWRTDRGAPGMISGQSIFRVRRKN